ncbi:MAG: glycosyltransferase, partial [Lachnospiraceae bacterium]|nr:glycosyltransferase [Lachnospiraceae bacterium]
CPQSCDKYAGSDPRLKVIHKICNEGLSAARNTGIDYACSEYIGFVDSDDYISEDMYECMYKLAKKYDADIVRVLYKECDENYNLQQNNKEKKQKEQVFYGKTIEHKFHDLRCESACVAIYKLSLMAKCRFSVGQTSEDIAFNFDMMKKAKTFVFLPECKYYYRYHFNSISNGKMGDNQLHYIYFRERIRDSYVNNNCRDLYKKADVLCTRAYFGSLLRVAMYGVTEGINEKDFIKKHLPLLRAGILPFILSPSVQISRKALALMLCCNFQISKILLRKVIRYYDKNIG